MIAEGATRSLLHYFILEISQSSFANIVENVGLLNAIWHFCVAIAYKEKVLVTRLIEYSFLWGVGQGMIHTNYDGKSPVHIGPPLPRGDDNDDDDDESLVKAMLDTKYHIVRRIAGKVVLYNIFFTFQQNLVF